MVMLSILQRLEPTKILVAGDLMLDAYTFGKAKRISPEAPVAVIHVQKEEKKAGGAGNVMLNLLSLGAEVVALGRIGEDAQGKLLINNLQKEGVNTQGILVQEAYLTPIKNRIIADNQQIVRVDHEQIDPLSTSLEDSLIEMIPALLEGVKIVAISDYGKGFLSPNLLRALINMALAKSIPIIADPKGIDFVRYSGVTVLKPNLSEAYAAARISPDAPLEQVADRLFQLSSIESLMITRSEQGISIFNQENERHDFPVRVKEVKDVTGAGDTVLAMLACAMANGLSLVEATQLSNVAAGIAIERIGCARITLSDLATRLLEIHPADKVFDEDHLFALKQILVDHHYILLGISDTAVLSSTLFRAIKSFSERSDIFLIVYLTQDSSADDLANVLISLREVDFVIRQTHNLLYLLDLLHPQEVYQFKENQLQTLPCVTALIS